MITLDLDKAYTYADYLRWTFEEQVELIKGKIFPMTPAPARQHQEISMKLIRLFLEYIKPDDRCQFYHPPFDVRLPQPGSTEDEAIINVVQPDLCIVCDPNKLDERGCLGAPDLIIEILSPSTSNKDLTDKFNLYQESGVAEYWVVFPGEHVVMVYALDEPDRFTPAVTYTSPQRVPVGIFHGELEIDLSQVFTS
ncbi:MAG TPA: hypothetical protein DCE41_10130 [Cytophagales bacterium]|nr:hypothetical protein [Cytophagales bacterium]HAA20284.1 hypothetical protein [Cytophagales bacterium]HAP63295.1 hypothetical protein [Cytophagales bacterium]